MQREITERFVDEYLERFVTAKPGEWNYIDGCLMSAVIMMYEKTGLERYRQFVIDYYEQYIDEEGNIKYYRPDDYNIDSINCGKGLFFVYEHTGEEKYKKAMELLIKQVKNQPRTYTNNFWHKKIYPNQVWLDGLYMGQVFYMKYDTIFGKKENYADIITQFKNVRKYLYNEEKGLHYHAIDMAKIQPWADKKTGLSENFWLRACGWHLMALIDTMEAMDDRVYEYYRELGDLFKEAVKGILKYQDPETGLFYQVVDRADVERNYLETSGSGMIGYAILKACRMKVLLSEKYYEYGVKIFEGLTKYKVEEIDGVLKIGGICKGAGLSDDRNGTVEYYLSEPIVYDDHKGAAPYIMCYAELL